MSHHFTKAVSSIRTCSPTRLSNHARLLSLSSPVQSEKSGGTKPKAPHAPVPASSCPENTVLTGLNYLKDQQPVLAKKDEDYPSWLWSILKPKPIPNDGPGGKGEKMQLRAANRQRIKEQNFLKTQ